jgi:hypothetical protein
MSALPSPSWALTLPEINAGDPGHRLGPDGVIDGVDVGI